MDWALVKWRVSCKFTRGKHWARTAVASKVFFESDFEVPPPNAAEALGQPRTQCPGHLPSVRTTPPVIPSVAWNGFYGRHKRGKFFHPRSSLLAGFPELKRKIKQHFCSPSVHCFRIHEVGAGNGSSFASLVGLGGDFEIFASDFSTEALSQCRAARQ